MDLDRLQTGLQYHQSQSLEQLRQLVGKGGHSALATHATAVLTQLESWVTANPTQNTSDQVRALKTICEPLLSNGDYSLEMAQLARLALGVVYPQVDWEVRVKARGRWQVQAKMRLLE